MKLCNEVNILLVSNLLLLFREYKKKLKIVGKIRPVACGHRISRNSRFTFLSPRLNRGEYPDKHQIVAKS